jgi:hypothetical protein
LKRQQLVLHHIGLGRRQGGEGSLPSAWQGRQCPNWRVQAILKRVVKRVE